MNTTVLCADIGSSSLKAALIDCQGNVLAKSRRQFSGALKENFSAATEWKKIFLEAAEECFSFSQIMPDAVCISGNGPTLVNQNGKTLLWNTKVEQNSHSLFIPRIQYFKQNFSQDFSSSEFIFSGPEFLIWQLTGKALTILPEERYLEAYWSSESLALSGLSKEDEKKLPPYQAPGSSCGTFTFHQKEIAVYAGAPDFVSALIGTSTIQPLKLCDRAGSSEGLNLCTQKALFAPKLRTLPSAIPDLWNLSYLIPQSGALFASFKNELQQAVGKKLSYEETVSLCLHDSTELAQRGKILMEKTALEVKQGLDELKKALEEKGLSLPEEMTVTGGQANNLEWLKMKSEISEMELLLPECTDAELLGDSVMAFTGMEIFENFQQGAQKICRIKNRVKGSIVH